jgi:hypothetical protein
LAEAIAARLDQLYRPGSESGCPGQENCQFFQQSAEDEHGQKFCPTCPGDYAGEVAAEFRETVDRVQRLVQERDSGYPTPLSALTPFEFEGIILWDETVAAHKRAHEERVATIFEYLMAVNEGGRA